MIVTPAPATPDPIGPDFAIDERHAREAPEGVYSHAIIGGTRFAILCVGHPRPLGPVSVVTLLDEFLNDRTETATRFLTALRHQARVRDPRLTVLRRRVLRQMLQAIDGRQAGATYQDIATTVLRAPPASAITWKSMSQRDTIMRRVRDGLKLVAGDYRLLLQHHRPR